MKHMRSRIYNEILRRKIYTEKMILLKYLQ